MYSILSEGDGTGQAAHSSAYDGNFKGLAGRRHGDMSWLWCNHSPQVIYRLEKRPITLDPHILVYLTAAWSDQRDRAVILGSAKPRHSDSGHCGRPARSHQVGVGVGAVSARRSVRHDINAEVVHQASRLDRGTRRVQYWDGVSL